MKEKDAALNASAVAKKADIDNSLITKAIVDRPLQEHQARGIAKALSVAPENFGYWLTQDAPESVYCELQSILDSYQELSADDVVCIASPDGFLERHNAKLMQAMVALVQRGVRVFYVFPSGRNRSSEDFLEIRRQLLSEHGIGLAPSLSGFEVADRDVHFFGWNTRYIVVFRTLQDPGRLRVRHAYIYTIGTTETAERDAMNPGSPLWVRQPREKADELAGLLLRAIDPVPDLIVLDDRLHRRLQQCYRDVFSEERWAAAYRGFRDDEAVKALINEISSRIGKTLPIIRGDETSGGETRVLDIGTGDGVLFSRFVDSLRDRGDFHSNALRPVLIDSTFVKTTEPDDPRANSYVQWLGKPFELYDCASCSYELIVSIHAFYLIDPSYLKKAYQLLAPNGHLFLVTSPRSGNAINALSRAVDDVLIKLHRWHDGLTTTEKTDGRGSLRVYSEEIESEAARYFGRVNAKRYECRVRADVFFDADGNLTDNAKDMVRVFASRVLRDDEVVQHVLPLAKGYLEELREGDTIRNEVVIVHLSKSDVRRSARFSLA